MQRIKKQTKDKTSPLRHRLAGCLLLTLCSDSFAADLHLADAVRLALAQNPELHVQQTRIDAARGRQLQAAGEFDWGLSAAILRDKSVTPLTDSALAAGEANGESQSRVQSGGYQLGLNRQLRNGMRLGLTADASSSQSNAWTPARPQQNLVKLDVSLTVPLLAGRGNPVVTSQEEAARLELLASRFELRERTAQTLYAVLQAYWQYRTRIELEQVAANSAERSHNLLLSIQKLVDASEKPRADLVLLRADHADKLIARKAAALASSDAKKALGRLLGLDAAAINALPEAADSLPPVVAVSGSNVAAFQTLALAQRADVHALALKLEAAQRQMKAAGDALKPRLDLQLGAGFAKASEGGSRPGFPFEAGRNQSSPSLHAQLRFQFPLQNSQASGTQLERSSQLAALAVRQRDLNNDVTSSVGQALSTLLSAKEQLGIAHDALGLYEQAVNQEIIKQKNGIATLIDVINLESRFVNARVNYLQLQLAWANALARLRLETGSFLPPMGDAATPDRFSIDMADLASPGPLADLPTRR